MDKLFRKKKKAKRFLFAFNVYVNLKRLYFDYLLKQGRRSQKVFGSDIYDKVYQTVKSKKKSLN